MNLREKIINFLRWSEKYTETDMVYLVKGSFWLILGKLIIFTCSFLILVAFANLVPREVYGSYQYVLSIVAVLVIFTLPGIDMALVGAVARGKESTIFRCAKAKIKWGIAGGIICLAISVYYFSQLNFALGVSFLIASLFLPIMDTFRLYYPFWQGKKRFDLQNKYLIATYLGADAILILVLFLTNNLAIILLSYFLSHTFLRFIFFKITLEKITNQEEEKETISFGKHLTLMQAVGIFGNQLDKILIWQFLGPVSLAIYSFAFLIVIRLRDLIPILPLALPKLSEKNLLEVKDAIFQKFWKLFLVSLPLTIGYFLAAPYLFKIFFPAYLESIPYTKFLGLTLIFIPSALLSAAFISQRQKRELYWHQIGVPLFKIILILVLVPLCGIWGAVTAFLASQIFGFLLLLFLFWKI